jgi:hypothetical protein
MLLEWCLTAGQATAASPNSSCVAIDVAPILTPCQTFRKWVNKYMDSVFGPAEAPVVAAQHPGTTTNAVALDNTRILERLVNKVESWDNKNPPTVNSHSNEIAPKGQKYDDYDRAAIKGFAGIVNDREIPRFYLLVQTTNNVNHHRINLDKGMRLWSEHMRIEIDEGVFFLKDNIESFVKVEPYPGECKGHPN